MTDYDKNLKPIVTVPATLTPFKQTDQNLAPVVNPVASKSAFGSNLMPTNSVTDSSSARLQKASRLGGRVTMAGSQVNWE